MINGDYTIKKQFKDSAFFEQKSNLSLFFSSNSLIFCEFTADFTQIIQLVDVEFNIQNNPTLSVLDRLQFICNNYQLIKTYNKVYISILNLNFTLIPNAFASLNNEADLLKFGTGLTTVKNSLEHTLSNLNFCYTVEQDLKQFLEKTFPTAFIRHAGAVSLSLFTNQPFLANSDLFLNINYNIIEITIKQKNNLQFYNAFNYQTTEDIIYYLLFTLEQLQLNPLTVKIAIAGQTDSNSELIISLKKYIKHINFTANNTATYFKNELIDTPPHFYFTVLNQILCEL